MGQWSSLEVGLTPWGQPGAQGQSPDYSAKGVRHWDRKWAILERRVTRQSFDRCLHPQSDWFEVSVELRWKEKWAGALSRALPRRCSNQAAGQPRRKLRM